MSAISKAVFLSYAHEDADAAKQVAEVLRTAGVEVWFDQNELRGGDAWDRKIKKQIKECALFVPVVSRNTQARKEGYFRLEWRHAEQRTHLMGRNAAFLVPVCIDDTKDEEADVPDAFLEVQWTRMRKQPDQGTLDALVLTDFAQHVKGLIACGDIQFTPMPFTMSGAPMPSDAPRIDPVAPVRAATPATEGRRVPVVVWIAAIMAVAAAIGYFVFGGKSPNAGAEARPPTVEKTAPAKIDEKSIAVLPFENMSDDKASGYFADGVQEDVITNLAFIPGLKVVPQPTAMRYRDSKKPIRVIAQELGVAYVLFGTVRRSGNEVRITGRLMNGGTEEQLWMKPFQKNLTDQFEIQAALATEIAGALQAVISPETRKLIRRVPTENAAAYDKFLQAREIVNRSGPTSPEAAVLLQDAVTLDPKFAAALAWQAKVDGFAYLSNADHSPERLRKAKTAIDTAVRLAPDDPDVILNLGLTYYHESRDYARALEQFERGARVQPGAAIWIFSTAGMQRRMGKWPDALANYHRAAQIDPGNPDCAAQPLAVALAGRRFDDALIEQQRLAELRDDANTNEFAVARIHFSRDGSTDKMEAFLARFPPNAQRAQRRTWAATTGNYAEAIRLDGESPARGDTPVFEMALCFAASGDLAAARQRVADFAPLLREKLKTEPENANAWGKLGCVEAVLGNADEALRCARKSVELLPESIDTWAGPGRRADLAFVYAWTGDKSRAIAEYARVLRTAGQAVSASFGLWPNVHLMKRHPAFFPLQGDPRFQKLLDDPKNNAPLF